MQLPTQQLWLFAATPNMTAIANSSGVQLLRTGRPAHIFFWLFFFVCSVRGEMERYPFARSVH
jgi:hypothetical protein